MNSQNKTDLDLVQRHVNELGEHFDSVVIFATRHEAGGEGGTVNVNIGTGNWFARYGQIREWLLKNDEQTRINVHNSQGTDPEDRKGEP